MKQPYHDVRAHLHGGVPNTEVDSLTHFWQNYPQLQVDAFVPKDDKYLDFAPMLAEKRAIADFVATHQSVTQRHQQFRDTLATWWQENVHLVQDLAPNPGNQSGNSGNVYKMRSSLLNSIQQALANQNLLTPFQVRGAFANYVDLLKADFKSIAASGWGAELIPDEEILPSQFPEILEEQEQSQTRLAELQALFAAANEEEFEDSDDTGVLPNDEVKSKKDDLKTANAEWKAQLKLLKSLAGNLYTELKALPEPPPMENKSYYCTEGMSQKDPQFSNGQRIVALAAEVGYISEYITPLKDAILTGQQTYDRSACITTSLKRHQALEDELKTLRATIKAIGDKRDELVQSARIKISTNEARTVIIARLRQTLMDIYETYLRADQRACIKAIENLWAKYAVTAKEIEAERDRASRELQAFLVELGYE